MSSDEEEVDRNKMVTAPPWDKDSDYDSCMSCGVKFNIITRWKHHCRKCGKIFCSECAPSDNRFPIPEFGYKKPVRHCLRCSMGDIRDLGTVRFDKDIAPARLRLSSTESGNVPSPPSVEEQRGAEEDVMISSRSGVTFDDENIYVSDRVIYAKYAHGSGALRKESIGLPTTPHLNSPEKLPKFSRVDSTMFHRKVSRKGKAPDDFWRQNLLRSSLFVKSVEKILNETVHISRDPEFLHFLNNDDAKNTLNDKNCLMEVGQAALKMFKKEFNDGGKDIIHLDAPVKVFGSLNGDIKMLLEIFTRFGAPSHRVGDVNTIRYLFAGNFIGNMEHSLEMFTLLMCLKLRYHPRVIILRGRNEMSNSSSLKRLREDTLSCLGIRDGKQYFEECVKPIFDLLTISMSC